MDLHAVSPSGLAQTVRMRKRSSAVKHSLGRQEVGRHAAHPIHARARGADERGCQHVQCHPRTSEDMDSPFPRGARQSLLSLTETQFFLMMKLTHRLTPPETDLPGRESPSQTCADLQLLTESGADAAQGTGLP